VAAGSLLGVELSRAASFPVGKVELHTLHPLDFFEFLDATGREAYRARLEGLAAIEPLPAGIHAELIAALREYLVVGGMPEAVAAFGASHDFARIRQIQGNIVAAYRLDFAKHAPLPLVPRLAMLWDAIPGQLARENRRFLFSAVQQGARARDYEDAFALARAGGARASIVRRGDAKAAAFWILQPSAFQALRPGRGFAGRGGESFSRCRGARQRGVRGVQGGAGGAVCGPAAHGR
jgi:hypothetical protein